MIGNVFAVLNTKTWQIKLVSKIVTLKNVCIKAFFKCFEKRLYYFSLTGLLSTTLYTMEEGIEREKNEPLRKPKDSLKS